MKHLKTLVVHPDDRSTDFLKAIYAGIPNCTVMTSGTIWEVDLAIQAADQVILLGHGTKRGLLALDKFKGGMYCIDHQSAPLLHGKKVIGIWCYCSDYMKEHGIENCFATNMFISEVLEANYCGLPGHSKEQIDLQCKYFCDLVGAVIDRPVKKIYDFVSEEFAEAALGCKIADYNCKGLYLS
jgi:hypothetical protein